LRAEGGGARRGRLRLEGFAPECRTFTVWKSGRGGWRGHWERFEGMRVELRTLPWNGPCLSLETRQEAVAA